jgi:hypothetical protein
VHGGHVTYRRYTWRPEAPASFRAARSAPIDVRRLLS